MRMHSALVTGAKILTETHKKFSSGAAVVVPDVDPENEVAVALKSGPKFAQSPFQLPPARKRSSSPPQLQVYVLGPLYLTGRTRALQPPGGRLVAA